MNSFKKVLALLLCAVLLLAICSCEISVSDSERDNDTSDRNDKDNKKSGGLSTKKAEAACEDFMEVLCAGDIEAVNSMVPMGPLLYGGEDEALPSDGIMSDIFALLTYSIEGKEALEDGRVLINLKIENVDLKALLLSLPDDIQSKEEARSKMKELLPTAARKTFDAEAIFMAVGEDKEPILVMTQSLANALTGGMNDIISELIAEEMTNAATN